jgi:3-hydroxy-3-methylglutaryl CoA synthase
VEDAWLAAARPVVDEVLEKDRLRREDIDLVVPAQVSPGFLTRLPEAIGVSREKVADFSADLPDTLSTSVFLALSRVLDKAAAPRRNILLLAVGSGITVGAATYRFAPGVDGIPRVGGRRSSVGIARTSIERMPRRYLRLQQYHDTAAQIGHKGMKVGMEPGTLIARSNLGTTMRKGTAPAETSSTVPANSSSYRGQ